MPKVRWNGKGRAASGSISSRSTNRRRDQTDFGNKGEGIISYQVVQEFFSVAFRRFPQAMSVAEAEQYLVTVLRPLLAVHSSPTLYFEALRIAEKHRLSWYDSLIVAAALEGNCETLYSEDLQHGRTIEGLRIENPFR
jgi:predicted nucleic acid-binding protein